MANKSIVMSKLRRLLQLYSQGKSKLFISNYLKLSRNTVNRYITHFKLLDKPFEEIKNLSDLELERLFVEQEPKDASPRFKTLYEFLPYMDKELKKTGVTKNMMWKEYLQKHPNGFMSTQFCEHYKRWSKKVNLVMYINHKAADKMYVDYVARPCS